MILPYRSGSCALPLPRTVSRLVSGQQTNGKLPYISIQRFSCEGAFWGLRRALSVLRRPRPSGTARALKMAALPCPGGRQCAWRSKWPAPACSGAASALERAVRACFGAAGVLEMAALACPSAASPLEKAVQACFGATSALKKAVRACFGATSALRKSCLSLLRWRQSARRGCSHLLFETTIRKCWSRLHCAVSHCTLHCFAPCMDMHGSTLVYIYL